MSRFDRYWPGIASALVDTAVVAAIFFFFHPYYQELCINPPSIWLIVVFFFFLPAAIRFLTFTKIELFHNLFPLKKRTAKYVELWKKYDFPKPLIGSFSLKSKRDNFVDYLESTALDDRLPFETRHEALKQFTEVAPSASFYRQYFAERQKVAGVHAALEYGKFLEDAPPKKKTRRKS
jgi:hypothetical protein